MTVFTIQNEADDGSVWQTGVDSAGSIDGQLSVTAWVELSISIGWVPKAGQKTVKFRIRNTLGTIVYTSGCHVVSPSQTELKLDNLFEVENINVNLYPFELLFDIYDGNNCTGIKISNTVGGWVIPTTTTISDFDKLYIGDNGVSRYNAGSWMRYTNVIIPAGATLLNANLTIQSLTNGGTKDFKFYAEQVDDATTNPSSYADFHSRVTLSGLSYSVNNTPWSAGFLFTYDIKIIVQQIIDRGGWASGNALMILWYDPDRSILSNFGTDYEGQDYPSLSSPTLGILWTLEEESVGTSTGTGTANGVSQFGVIGTAIGVADVTGFGDRASQTTGTAAGVGDADGAEGLAASDTIGTSAGIGDADGAVGLAASDAIGSSNGMATVTGIGEIGTNAAGTAAGTSTVTGIVISAGSGVGIAAGTSEVLGVGSYIHSTTGTSAGIGAANAVREALVESAGSAVGVGDADGAEGLQGSDAIGSIAGTSTTVGIAGTATGIAAGTSTATAVREALVASTGTITGTATVTGGGGWLAFTTITASGSSLVEGRSVTTAEEFLDDLDNRRRVHGANQPRGGARGTGKRRNANNSARFLELSGATIIEPTAFEPDAATHRESHYYNAVTNILYRKVVTRNEPGVIVAHWQKVSG